eukprot:3169271-Rhodomonas_salina.2
MPVGLLSSVACLQGTKTSATPRCRTRNRQSEHEPGSKAEIQGCDEAGRSGLGQKQKGYRQKGREGVRD